MAAGLNPEEIHGFLQGIARGSGYSSSNGYDDFSSTGYAYAGYPAEQSTPRAAPDHNFAGYSQYECSDHFEEEDTPSEHYTAQPTIFSQPSRYSQSSIGRSSAPSVGGHFQSFAQFAAAGPLAEQASQPQQQLWCEFQDLHNCNARFQLDEQRAWIEHHVEHLFNRYPRQSTCWFCNDPPFVADRPLDAYSKFVERMQHIHRHIIEDDGLTNESVRPDFHFLNHLHNEGLIDEETYRHAMNYDELPRSYQLPGANASPSMASHQRSDPRAQGQMHDLEREERRERRRNRERSDRHDRRRGR
ncbi:hypothetical protein QBC35DRAFT_124347 [Podospora australis]|uniref:Uncharacterized protein n=1 Tax=Podospora australis TaxID=1536484 RepID=A0AAN7AJW7_9PEZI|nr:hypothetical protein QBC35DRAFT_124347 [Podospora australis]